MPGTSAQSGKCRLRVAAASCASGSIQAVRPASRICRLAASTPRECAILIGHAHRCLLLTTHKMTVLAAVPGTVAQHGLAEGEGISPMTALPIRLDLEPSSKMMPCNHQKCCNGHIVRSKGCLAEARSAPFTLFCLLAALEPDRLVGAIAVAGADREAFRRCQRCRRSRARPSPAREPGCLDSWHARSRQHR